MENERLDRQLSFILELDKMKEILRQTYLCDASRRENDAEHSWHLAVMTAVLSEYANTPIDVGHTMMMVLLHDVIEIDAGDTYAYDPAGNLTKRDREVKAADRIYRLLPGDQAAFFRSLWDEFEAGTTAEAKFANAMDKIQPILLNAASGGLAWKEHGIRKEQVTDRNVHTHEGSEVLWQKTLEIISRYFD